MSFSKPLHVAVGVIKNHEGNILISFRDDSLHQGGLWEFPGGKVDKNESVEQALKRELKEELDITILQCSPLIKIKHQYADLLVLLDVWMVTLFSGQAIGREGQAIKWVSIDKLTDYEFPDANISIISAIKLPSEYAILNGHKKQTLLKGLHTLLDNGVKLIQFRAKSLPAQDVMELLQLAIPLCKQKGAILLINSAVKNVGKFKAEGIHLTASDLLALEQRPKGYAWVSASCHNKLELNHAQKIAVDFAVLAPVLATTSHPDAKLLGWRLFKQLTDKVNFPVFALGGMQQHDKETAQNAGGQGIAGISAFY